tara:strand:+ start:144 stop:719 length:576 start_codon:yes stop_codon:yes gene_type:complete
MIYVIDDFIEPQLFPIIKNYLSDGPFKKQVVGGKDFYIKESPEEFNEYVTERLSKAEGRPVVNILSFFRESTDELDITWRIHSDLNIDGQKPDRAVVLYLSPREREELHGTALWEHHIYGKALPEDISNEEYDRMISVDAEDLDRWRLSSVLGYESNRLISYPSSYFHSKYPNKSWKEGRQVFVMFYKFNK